MSAHADPPAVAVDAHDTHAADELLPGEPHSPAWLPLVGSVVFLVAIVLFVATRPPGKTAEQLSRESQIAAQERAERMRPKTPEAPAAAMAPSAPGAPGGAPRKGG